MLEFNVQITDDSENKLTYLIWNENYTSILKMYFWYVIEKTKLTDLKTSLLLKCIVYFVILPNNLSEDSAIYGKKDIIFTILNNL